MGGLDLGLFKQLGCLFADVMPYEAVLDNHPRAHHDWPDALNATQIRLAAAGRDFRAAVEKRINTAVELNDLRDKHSFYVFADTVCRTLEERLGASLEPETSINTRSSPRSMATSEVFASPSLVSYGWSP